MPVDTQEQISLFGSAQFAMGSVSWLLLKFLATIHELSVSSSSSSSSLASCDRDPPNTACSATTVDVPYAGLRWLVVSVASVNSVPVKLRLMASGYYKV